MIAPENRVYLVWTLAMAAVIAAVALYLPYSLVYGSTGGGGFENAADVFFYLDLALNFNVGYLDAGNQPVLLRTRVVRHYLRGWFVVDFLATFPFDRLLTQEKYGAMKVIRVLRLFRLAKLGKLLKKNYVMEIIKRSKPLQPYKEAIVKYTGPLRMLKDIALFVLIAHYYSIFYMLVLQSPLSEPSWLHSNYQTPPEQRMLDLLHSEPYTVYKRLMYDLLSTAFVFYRPEFLNSREHSLNLAWMVFGIGFFSYVISNVYKHISTVPEKEAWYAALMEVAAKVELNPQVSELTLHKIKDAIEDQVDLFESQDYRELQPYVSYEVFTQLKYQLNADVANCFKLFGMFTPEFLERVSQLIIKQDDFVLFKVGHQAEYLHCVISGKVTVYDARYAIQENCFAHYLVDYESFSAHLTKLKMSQRFLTKLKVDVEIEELQVTRTTTALAERGSEYYVLSYAHILDLLELDDTFVEVAKAYAQEMRQSLTLELVLKTQAELVQFAESEQPALLVLEDGMIYCTNQAWDALPFPRLVGRNLVEVLFNSYLEEVHLAALSSFEHYFLALHIWLYPAWLSVAEKRLVISRFVLDADSLLEPSRKFEAHIVNCYLITLNVDLHSRTFWPTLYLAAFFDESAHAANQLNHQLYDIRDNKVNTFIHQLKE